MLLFSSTLNSRRLLVSNVSLLFPSRCSLLASPQRPLPRSLLQQACSLASRQLVVVVVAADVDVVVVVVANAAAVDDVDVGSPATPSAADAQAAVPQRKSARRRLLLILLLLLSLLLPLMLQKRCLASRTGIRRPKLKLKSEPELELKLVQLTSLVVFAEREASTKARRDEQCRLEGREARSEKQRSWLRRTKISSVYHSSESRSALDYQTRLIPCDDKQC